MTRPSPSSLYGAPVIGAGETVAGIGRRLTGIVLDPPAGRSRLALAAGLGLLALVLTAVAAALALPASGLLGAGDDTALVLATDAAAYDWWVGAAGGSLLVAGVPLLARAEWRGGVGRIAETTALLCAIAAWLHPLLHLDRPSILRRDAAGLFTLLVVCASLWSIGLLPDLAALRDRAFEIARARSGRAGAGTARLRARVYGLLAAGWRGAAVQWQRRGEAYRHVALLACLLVIVQRAGAALVPAASALPGGPDTLMPVTLLVGAVLAGTGLTAAIGVAVRAAYRLDALITDRHLDVLARTILALGLAGLYCHAVALFSGLLHGDPFAEAADGGSVQGLRILALAGLLPAQLFWLPRARRSGLAVGLVGVLVALGTYADHMILTILGLRDALPDPDPAPTVVLRATTTLAGAAGLFLLLLLLILRGVPVVSIAATRALALAHNGRAAARAQAPAEDGGEVRAAAFAQGSRHDAPPSRGIGAAFASEKALAAAIRALGGGPARLDGYGPIPMPEVAEALRLPARRMRLYALAGAGAGGLGFLALRLRPETWSQTWTPAWPERIDLSDPLASLASVLLPAGWPALLVSGLAAALTAGTLAVHLALLLPRRLPQPGRPRADLAGFLRAGRDGFLLAAAPRDGAEADRVAARLAALPADDGRPLAIRRLAR